MDGTEILNRVLFSIGEFDVKLGQLLLLLLIIFLLFKFGKVLSKNNITKYFEEDKLNQKKVRSLRAAFYMVIAMIFIVIFLQIFNLNYILLSTESYQLTTSHILYGLIVFQLTRLLDWFISNVYIHKYFQGRDDIKEVSKTKVDDGESTATNLVKYIFYIIGAIIILQIFKIDASLFHRTINGETFNFKISNILTALLIIIAARLVIWLLIQVVLYSFYRNQKVDQGAQFAINQLLKYVIYTFAIVMALEHLGINMTLLLGGAAALLVGIGLGLQQTFNDFISGIVLLFEQSVAVGDVLEVDTTIGVVKRIGMRSSILETRGNVSFILPNSKLVNEKVINWTHLSSKVRFDLPLTVAYGSDTKLVKKILMDVAKENPYIIQYPAPFVRFNEFGESALDFSLYFFSRNYMIIEDIKSDLRFSIDAAFRENNISIPFPQRDIRIVKEE